MEAAEHRDAGLARVLFDFSRGRQALLSVAQPALGALLALQGLPSTRILVLGLGAAATGYLSVFSLNDLLDRDVDREAVRLTAEPGRPTPAAAGYDLDVAFFRHPLARGDLSLALATAWVGGLGLVSLALAYAVRPLCALLFVACVALEATYCALKRDTWLKTVPAGIMVGLGGLAGWFAVGTATWGAAAFGLLLVLWEVAGRNLSNDLADLSADRAVGIVTVATTFGPVTAARWIFAGAAAMPVVALAQEGSPALRLAVAALAFWSMSLPGARLLRRPEETEAQRYFNRASLFPALALGAAAVFVLA